MALAAAAGCDPGDESVTATAGVPGATTSSGGDVSATEDPEATDGPADLGGTELLECVDVEDAEDLGSGATFRIRNDRDVPVFVDGVGCFGTARFELSDASGRVLEWRRGHCTPVFCSDFAFSTDCTEGCDDCGETTLIRLDPGASVEADWSGVTLTERSMDPACTLGQCVVDSCLRQDREPDGMHRVALDVYPDCSGECECFDEVGDICRYGGGANGAGAPDAVFVDFAYPSEDVVELVVE